MKRRAYGAKHRAQKQNATLLWTDRKKIERLYRLADIVSRITGHEHQVEHWVPLNSDVVCGLHWEVNQRIAPADINQSKGNRFSRKDPDGLAREGMTWPIEKGTD